MKPLISFSQWHSEYRRIARTLGINESRDIEATSLLSSLLEGRPDCIGVTKGRIAGHHVFVYGAGPSLENSFVGKTCIASDGATSYLLKKGRIPDIVVTDLDGRISDIMKASKAGSCVFVHAHGDNIPSLRKYVPRLANVVGTTQAKPEKGVYNFGGFTDGDRALFIAKAFGAKRIKCLGFDFGDMVGRYSKPGLKKNMRASPEKKKKLEIARYLIEKYGLCDPKL